VTVTETRAEYVTDEERPPRKVTEPDGAQCLPDSLRLYFERKRDALIAELRELDKVLGRPQTIPVRRR
jgi:hypothetical protein